MDAGDSSPCSTNPPAVYPGPIVQVNTSTFPGFYILSRTLPLLEIWRSNNSTDYGIFLLLPGLHTHMVVSSTARCIEGPFFKLFIRSNSMDCSLNDVPSPGVYV